MEDRRVLVCGGRDLQDELLVWNTLDAIHQRTPIALIIEGGARGADRFAYGWAIGAGLGVLTLEADWKKHGKAAGPIRNQQMLAIGRPDLVVAFKGGRGTADMVRRARATGVQVIEP